MSADHSKLPDHYTLLGVERDADEKTVKVAHRRFMRQWHPDLAGDQGERMSTAGNEAARVLTNPLLRREYDTKLTPDTPAPQMGLHPEPATASDGRSAPHTETADPGTAHTGQDQHHPGHLYDDITVRAVTEVSRASWAASTATWVAASCLVLFTDRSTTPPDHDQITHLLTAPALAAVAGTAAAAGAWAVRRTRVEATNRRPWWPAWALTCVTICLAWALSPVTWAVVLATTATLPALTSALTCRWLLRWWDARRTITTKNLRSGNHFGQPSTATAVALFDALDRLASDPATVIIHPGPDAAVELVLVRGNNVVLVAGLPAGTSYEVTGHQAIIRDPAGPQVVNLEAASRAHHQLSTQLRRSHRQVHLVLASTAPTVSDPRCGVVGRDALTGTVRRLLASGTPVSYRDQVDVLLAVRAIYQPRRTRST